MSDVFISYQWDSATIVHKICDKLEKEGQLKVWIDRNKMHPGDDIYKEMESGIRNSNVVVAFITKKYCDSDNCQFEIKFANQQKKSKCLYVMLEKGLEKQDLNGIGILIAANYRINAYKEADCSKDWSDGLFDTLLSAIKSKVSGSNPTREVGHNETASSKPSEIAVKNDDKSSKLKQIPQKLFEQFISEPDHDDNVQNEKTSEKHNPAKDFQHFFQNTLPAKPKFTLPKPF